MGVGTANLADSLEAMRKAVFEEGLLSYQDLLVVLERNWSGAGDEELHQRLVSKYPKYGNDIDEVDRLGARFLCHYGREVSKYQNVRSGTPPVL